LIEVIVQIWINAYTYAKFKILGLGPKSFCASCKCKNQAPFSLQFDI